MATEKSFVRCIELPAKISDSFAFHERTGALSRLIPPWENVVVESSDHSIQPGSEVVLKTYLGPIPLRWLARHTEYDPPNQFADEQVSGPFKSWNHVHRFSVTGEDSSSLEDSVTYRLPGGAAGAFFGGRFIERTLSAMFDYRHRVTRDDLTLQQQYPTEPLTVAISGSSGLVGERLTGMLSLAGHSVTKLMRGETRSDASGEHHVWASEFDVAQLEGTDAVVHLAGKSIADQRWNAKVKQEIMDSRVDKTRILCERLASMKKPPRVLVCASAIGIYGDRGDEVLDEHSAAGEGFLAEVGRQWEAACEPAIQAGIRVVNLRIGIVLSPRGGALQTLLLPAKLGVNGPVSHGKQWWSWIDIDDLLGAIYHCMFCDDIDGPVNAVAPEPETSRDFAKTLGRVLRRPAFLPAPAFALKLALGEMAGPLLLGSSRVTPKKLTDTGYNFRFQDLESSLRYQLGRT